MKWLLSCFLVSIVGSSVALAQGTDPCSSQTLGIDFGFKPQKFISFEFSDKQAAELANKECLDRNQKYEIVASVFNYGTETPSVGTKFILVDQRIREIGSAQTDQSGQFKTAVYITGSNQGSEGSVDLFPLLYLSGNNDWALCGYTSPSMRRLPVCGYNNELDPIDASLKTAKKLAKASKKKNGKNKKIKARLN